MLDKSTRHILLLKVISSEGLLSSFVEQHLPKQEKPNFISFNIQPGVSGYINEKSLNSGGAINFIVNFRGVSGSGSAVGANFNYPNACIITAEAVGKQSENMGSKLLEQQYGSAEKLNEIVAKALNYLKNKYPNKNINLGKIVISGFSGGGSVVASLATQRDKIKGKLVGIIINDGLHSNPNTAEGRRKLDAIVAWAKETQQDPNKIFKILHTAIHPGSYSSTTETANYLLDKLNLQRQKPNNSEEFKQYGFSPASMAKDNRTEVVQMYDKQTPYFADNRSGSLGDQHVQAVRKGNPYLFRDIFQSKT